MVRKSADKTLDVKKMFGGAGEAKMYRILEGSEEMYGKGRLFNHLVLEPGCEVGWHVHQGDGETYYILKGKGTYNDNGTTYEVEAGDVTYCKEGDWHGLVNDSTGDIEMVALILNK